jgi:hypothetical protein
MRIGNSGQVEWENLCSLALSAAIAAFKSAANLEKGM